MKYAVIQIGGKQIKITEGSSFKIERQKKLAFDVLVYSDDNVTLLGSPSLKDVKVDAKIEGEERGKKIRVARFKSKSRYHKVRGHRQTLSVVKVESIGRVSKEPNEKSVVERKKIVKEVKKTQAGKTAEKKSISSRRKTVARKQKEK